MAILQIRTIVDPYCVLYDKFRLLIFTGNQEELRQ